METKQNISKLIFAVGITLFNINAIQASEQSKIQWGKEAKSRILNQNRLAKLDAVFPAWKIRQMTWPSDSEISSKKVEVDPNLITSCMEWLAKFINKEQLPANLDKNLLAMKEWGLITIESEQKRLCDVFVARYKMGNYVVQIQESPCNVIIAVADERTIRNPRVDHKNFVVEIGEMILNDMLKSDPNSEDLHVFELGHDGQKVTRVSWILKSVTATINGRKVVDGIKECEIGASNVEAETDGRFVKFDIFKSIKGPREIPDPYVKRFSAQK